jgi:hypothetical protein
MPAPYHGFGGPIAIRPVRVDELLPTPRASSRRAAPWASRQSPTTMRPTPRGRLRSLRCATQVEQQLEHELNIE